jgi:CRISPR/Cas system CSM-associated protein Csm2 small subunit
MFQYLTSEYQNKRNWLDRVDKYKSDPYSPIEIKKFADKLKDMVCVLLRRVGRQGIQEHSIRRTLEKMVAESEVL